ncbi:DNase I-like protein [Panus rudis PR-1116 ss-1]|nr:DNase I-like protein [Panus rudis PR-1116 ss-1]
MRANLLLPLSIRQKIKKNTRAQLKIASLNMRGFGNPLSNNKWNDIHRMIKEERIGVLALQETHLTHDRVCSLRAQYGRRLEIIYSPDPTEPSQRAGVAIVINKDLANIKGISSTVIVPGRALLMQLPWHKDLKLSILAIYAPNNSSDNASFWNDIFNFWNTSQEPRPTIMLGDMNLVEDAIDRFPPHSDDANATMALRDVKSRLNLTDGWRRVYPDYRTFSYHQQQTGSMSRIDRIYIADRLKKSTHDWAITTTGINTDHNLVSMCITDRKSPFIGPGRWAIPPFVIEDKDFKKNIHVLGCKLAEDVKAATLSRTEDRNPQLLFQTFKKEALDLAQEKAKIAGSRLKKRVAKLRKNVRQLSRLTDGATLPSEGTVMEINILNERIAEIEKTRFQRAKLSTAARYRLEGETLSKYWTNVTKEKKPPLRPNGTDSTCVLQQLAGGTVCKGT